VSLVEAAIDRDDLPEMSMLVDERTLKDVMEDFLVASKAPTSSLTVYSTSGCSARQSTTRCSSPRRESSCS